MLARAEPHTTAKPLVADRPSDRLAADLRSRIDSGALQPGQRLPTELALAAQYAASRTVVREAVSRLRSGGLLVARQGSGVFFAAPDAARPLDFDVAVFTNLDAVLEVVEVRRTLEAEVAALAATRATPAQRAAISLALAHVGTPQWPRAVRQWRRTWPFTAVSQMPPATRSFRVCCATWHSTCVPP